MPIVWLFACTQADETDVERDVLAEITAPGPYGAGFARGEVAYVDEVGGGERSLYLAAWYPTNDGVGAGPVRYHGLIDDPAVLLDAAIADGTFPLAVFSHGHQGYAENSSFLMRHLASHGWVVLAPDHTGNTTGTGDRETPIYRQRARDISAVIDHAFAPGGAPFQGHVAEPVVAFGHSFGGYTLWGLGGATYDEAAIAACLAGTESSGFCSTMTEADAAVFRAGLADPRIVGIAPMAAGDFDLFGASGVAAVDVPVWMLTAELDGDDAQPYWDAVQASGVDRGRVVLAGAGHQSFTDFSGIIDDVPIAPETGFRIVNAYGLAFAAHLAGDAAMAPVLDGSLAVDPAATVLR